jgi:hypothetical protein
MIGPKTFTNYLFQIGVWSTIIFCLGMILFGSADLLLGLRWGFTLKDVFMTVVVLVGAIIVKLVGTKIIITFGGGM